MKLECLEVNCEDVYNCMRLCQLTWCLGKPSVMGRTGKRGDECGTGVVVVVVGAVAVAVALVVIGNFVLAISSTLVLIQPTLSNPR